MDPNIFSLLEHGGLIGALCAAVWFLNNRNDRLSLRVEQRYDAELCEVKRRLDDCEEDRQKLHDKIAAILEQHD